MQNTHVSLIKPAPLELALRSQLTKTDWLKDSCGPTMEFLGGS